jgi:riboflavin kinase/FMN adenylyltransferase
MSRAGSSDVPGTVPRTSALAVFRSLAEIPADFGPTVAAVGNFDGVHLGHREILAAVAAEAQSSNARAVAVTFDPHPEQFLRPAGAPRLITPLPERLRLLAETGIDAALVLPFDAALAHLPAREFAQRILASALAARSVHEGRNFRFGRGASADVADLTAMGKELGFVVRVHDAIRVRGIEVSSSAIRALVAAGEVRRARWMLGRPFAVLSAPVRGRGIGTRLVVPTTVSCRPSASMSRASR